MSLVHALVVVAAAIGGEPAGEVLDFSASYCGPCRSMTPIVAKLEREGLPIRKVDIEQHRDLADRYHITKIPTFVLVINGEEAHRVVGPVSEAELRRMCSRIPQAEPAVAADSPTARNQASESVVLTTEDKPSQPQPQGILDFLRSKHEEPSAVRGNSDDLASAAPPAAPTNDPMRASVRIRTTVKGEISFGSGTIVHSEPGRTLIVTCGHIFRNVNDSAKVEVDVFENGKSATYVASIEDFDLEADVGLLRITTHSTVSSAPVAPATVVLKKLQRVGCIGCSGGADPTRDQIEITEINKYDGPDTIECSTTPVQGRSGGGLFNAEGQLIGVCIAAVKEEPLGVYAHVFCVHKLLDKNNLSQLYRPVSQPAEGAFANDDTRPTDAPPADFPTQLVADQTLATETDTAPESAGPTGEPATPTDLAGVMADVETGDAEVVVIIRSKTKPSQNRVVIINRASPKFLAYLNGEIRPEGLAANRPTHRAPDLSLARPRRQDFAGAPRGPQSVQAQTQPVSFQPQRTAEPQSAVERSLSRRMTEARRITSAAR